MSTIMLISEGYVQFQGYKTWYRIVGDLANTVPGKFPVLMLHGGPGIPHDRLEPLKTLVETGRPVVFYDQLGCGNSDRDALTERNPRYRSSQELGYHIAPWLHPYSEPPHFRSL